MVVADCPHALVDTTLYCIPAGSAPRSLTATGLVTLLTSATSILPGLYTFTLYDGNPEVNAIERFVVLALQLATVVTLTATGMAAPVMLRTIDVS